MKTLFTGLGVMAFGASSFYAGYLLAKKGDSYQEAVDQGVRTKLRKMAEEVRTDVFRQIQIDEKFNEIVGDI